ncbi:hypothetical protein C8R44DRAFT_782858 [Mycena epipterygia]|nr:hypothetical protein C8R44DRAFT_782858 [Mycena epipterygia]
MRYFFGTLSLFLLTHGANSLPARRQDEGAISIQDSMASMYSMYLQSQNVGSKAFYPLFGGEQEIDFAGEGAQGSDMFTINDAMFTTADRLPHIANENSTGQLMFSIHYQHFIQALQNATQDVSSAQATELTNLSINQTNACITKLAAATDDAYAGYQKLHGTAKETDTIFIQFATENYGEYKEALLGCDAAKNAYSKALNNIDGDDAGIIQSAIDAMTPIINAENTWYPGLNMPISGASNTTNGATVGGQYTGTLVPYYAMPSLNSTLALWQSGTSNKAALTWNSSTSSRVSMASSQSASVTGHWLWDSASASENSNMSFILTQAQSADLSFGGIELIDVVRGAWFDGFRSASAVGTPASDDPLGKPHKAAFQTYFGTATSPGPAAIYNDKALVVFKPTATFTFGSQSDYNAAMSAQAQASVSGGLWGASASAAGSKTGFEGNNSTLTLSFTPNTENAYIVGFVMHSYWDDVSNTTIPTR